MKCRSIDRRFSRECEGLLPSFIRHRDAMSHSQARDGRSLEENLSRRAFQETAGGRERWKHRSGDISVVRCID